MIDPREALRYHAAHPPGKLAIRATKPTATAYDLSLAYSPGVAEPCRAIDADPERVFDYTAKGNLVGVVTNGSAVLGLGNIGPEAGKPVMEGKAVLFKRFAGIDVFDLELDAPDVDGFCAAVRALAPTFGGINLEDIKAPDCFVIEERLRRELDIPVFHDDQHGTAIITAAGLVNALHLQGKTLSEVKVVFSGAGAAALATLRLILSMGARLENVLLCDSKGVVHTDREDIDRNPYKARYAVESDRRTLADALVDADVFIGVSVADAVTPDMLRSMADKPVVFALANPDPEIPYPLAKEVRPDAIVGTGRSDFPNQVNNVLGFPFIFRGALDVRARTVDDGMMIAAVQALAELAREEVDDTVAAAYGGEKIRFGPEYVIPKPFDPRVLLRVAPAVAKAASESGVARRPLEDVESYRIGLERLLGRERQVLRRAISVTVARPQRIAFADGEHEHTLRAVPQLLEQGGITPLLVGDPDAIRRAAVSLELDLGLEQGRCEILDPADAALRQRFAEQLFERRGRRGTTIEGAGRLVRGKIAFAASLAWDGIADGMVAGLERSFPDTLRPILRVIDTVEGVGAASGVHLLEIDNQLVLFTDTTLQVDPSAEQIAESALLTADLAASFGETPRLAMISFSNFGSVDDPRAAKMRRAAELAREARPDLEIEGELHVETAWDAAGRRATFPFLRLSERANVLVFPSLEAGAVAQQVAVMAGADLSIGPLLVGLGRPANVLDAKATVRDVVRTATLTAMAGADRAARGS